MIAYIDSSVLLPVALGQPNASPEWHAIDRGFSSALIANMATDDAALGMAARAHGLKVLGTRA